MEEDAPNSDVGGHIFLLRRLPPARKELLQRDRHQRTLGGGQGGGEGGFGVRVGSARTCTTADPAPCGPR